MGIKLRTKVIDGKLAGGDESILHDAKAAHAMALAIIWSESEGGSWSPQAILSKASEIMRDDFGIDG